MKTNNINQYVQELERTISLLNSDNNAIKQIKEIFYEENIKLRKEVKWLEKENKGLKESLNFYQTKDN